MDEILPKQAKLVNRLFDAAFTGDLRGQKANTKRINSIFDLKSMVDLEDIKVDLEKY
jgi:hypothetical protein